MSTEAGVLALEAGLVCRDLPVMRRFCTEVLGFTVTDVRDFDTVGQVVKLHRDSARIKLFAPLDGARPERGSGAWYTPGGWRYVAVYLAEWDELLRLVEAVVAGGGRVLVAPAEHRPGAGAALVADPEGNAWELLWEAGQKPAAEAGADPAAS